MLRLRTIVLSAALAATLTSTGSLRADEDQDSDEGQGVVVISPENARFLHKRLHDRGTIVVKIDRDNTYTYRERVFGTKGAGDSCFDIQIETREETAFLDPPEIIFDSFCQLPYQISGKTYWLWAHVRVHILSLTGEVTSGAPNWLDTMPGNDDTVDGNETIYPVEGSLKKLISEKLLEAIELEKRYAAHGQ